MSFDDADKGALAEAMESAAFEIHKLEEKNVALQSELTQLRENQALVIEAKIANEDELTQLRLLRDAVESDFEDEHIVDDGCDGWHTTYLCKCALCQALDVCKEGSDAP